MNDGQRQADLVTTGVQALVARSQALGLTWIRRLATVSAANDANSAVIVVDGDTTTVTAFSMVGIVVPGERVYVDIIPPGGHFIVGTAVAADSPTRADLYGAGSYGAALAADTTTSATYVDMSGPPLASFTKFYDSTRIAVWLDVSAFVTASANTGIACAVLVGVTDYPVSQFFFNALATHQQVSGSTIITGVPAGTIDVVARWRRHVGAGTLAVNGDDWISILAQEIA